MPLLTSPQTNFFTGPISRPPLKLNRKARISKIGWVKEPRTPLSCSKRDQIATLCRVCTSTSRAWSSWLRTQKASRELIWCLGRIQKVPSCYTPSSPGCMHRTIQWSILPSRGFKTNLGSSTSHSHSKTIAKSDVFVILTASLTPRLGDAQRFSSRRPPLPKLTANPFMLSRSNTANPTIASTNPQSSTISTRLALSLASYSSSITKRWRPLKGLMYHLESVIKFA